MVVINNFKAIIEDIQPTEILTLPTLKKNALRIEYFEDDRVGTICDVPELPLPFASSEVLNARISSWKRLTANEGDCKAIYEVTFDIEETDWKFKAGDTIGVIPHNDDCDVDLILLHLGLATKADIIYGLSVDPSQKAKIPVHVPVRSTLRHVLTHCLDLRSILKKLFLLALSKHTKDENERRTLEYLCSKEGSIAYTTHVLNKSLCLLDIFRIFKTCKPPIEVLLANLPRLLPRPYSIVNSGLKNNKIVKICFSVMAINNRKGLTTGWLEKIILNEDSLEEQLKNLSISTEMRNMIKVPIYLRNNLNQFCIPEKVEVPLILIGPGTGIAPFMGFLEERELLKTNEVKLGETWLFFGCRDPKLDFIYKEELDDYIKRGILSKLNTAFSRIENSKAKYIQDALKQDGRKITQLIKNGATIFVCGDLNTMATQMKEVLIQCLVDHDNLSYEEGEKMINVMQKEKRYIVDAWG